MNSCVVWCTIALITSKGVLATIGTMHARIVETLVDVCKNPAVACLSCNLNIFESILETVNIFLIALLRWFLRNKVAEEFFFSFFNFPWRCIENYNKKGRLSFPLKIFDGPIILHLCLITRVTSLVHARFCGSWKQRLFKQYLKKSW